MPDEKRPPDPNTPPDDSSRAGDDLSASTIFVEMMRQAAARRAAMGLTPPDTPPAPAEPRQPPQHVSPKSDRRSGPRAPEPPANPEQKPPTPTISEIPDRPERLPTSRRARPPRRETPTETHPIISTGEPTQPPAALSLPREDAPSVTSEPPNNRNQAPEAPVETPDASDRALEDSRPRPTVRRMTAAPAAVPPPVDEDEGETPEADEADEAIQEQKIRRVQRRKERQFRRRAGMIGGFVRTAIIVIIAALLASTIFTWFTRPDFFKADVAENLEVARATGIYIAQPTALPTPNWLRKIGVVSGHRGPQSDPGAVCPDGLKEADINFAVAQIVVKNLRAQGYSVDLLDEFDPRLDNYQAAALVSIHANTCQDWGGEIVSGFLVAKAAARAEGGLDTLLSECIANQYGLITGLDRRFNLTIDMTDYHTFREIHPFTPASIIELGFLLADREVLTMRQDDMGRAITEGILCFLQPQQPMGGVVTATPGEFIPTPTLATPGP